MIKRIKTEIKTLKLKFNIIIDNIGKALQAVGAIPKLSFWFQ